MDESIILSLLEGFLSEVVIPELKSDSEPIRARACSIFKEYGVIEF